MSNLSKKSKIAYLLAAAGFILAGGFIYMFGTGSGNSFHFQRLLGVQVPATDQSPRGQAPARQDVTLIAAGDIMLSRTVGSIILKNGVDYPFQNIHDYLHSADIAFANLENPITAGPEVPPGSLVFHANPGTENGLQNAGIKIVSLANNHTPNYGDKGILDTVQYLNQVGIKHIGAGADLAAADAPVFIQLNGIKFAFIAYNDHDTVPDNYAAAPNHPGTNIMDIEKVTRDVKAAKSQADIVIVSMHSGHEYQPTPDDSQTNFAHAAIDAGAEMVIGHHPHVIQTAEVYKGKYIFYSLGNFVFDQAFSSDVQTGMTIKATFLKTGLTNVEFHPVWIENKSQPGLITDPEQYLKAVERLGLAK